MTRLQIPSLAALAAAVALTGVQPAQADFLMERELALEPGGRFVLDTDSGKVKLRGSDRAGVRIRISSERDDVEERFSFDFSERSGVASVAVERRGSWPRRWFSSSDRLEFEIELPNRADLEIETAGGAIDAEAIEGTLDLDTSGGSIRLSGLAGRIDAHTSGGAIDASRLAGEVTLKTSGGSIRVEGIDGNLLAGTSGGSINVRDVTGRLEADTSGGSVTAYFDLGNSAGGKLSTSGGSVTAYVDPAAALDIDASTSGGRVVVEPDLAVDGTVSRQSVRGRLNGGGAKLVLRSSGGGVRLRAR